MRISYYQKNRDKLCKNVVLYDQLHPEKKLIVLISIENRIKYKLPNTANLIEYKLSIAANLIE